VLPVPGPDDATPVQSAAVVSAELAEAEARVAAATRRADQAAERAGRAARSAVTAAGAAGEHTARRRCRRGEPLRAPGPALRCRVGVRTGFGLALGALLAYELLQSVLAVRQVLVVVLISAFLAVGLDPAVTTLTRRLRRSVAVGLVMLAFVGLFAGFVAAVAPPVTGQVTQLVEKAPVYVQELQDNPRIRASTPASGG